MQVPRALPLHMQPPPSVPRGELARLGIQYLSPLKVRDMIESRNYGQASFAIVDLRDEDFFGGHIPGCDHISSRSFVSNVNAAVRRLEGVPLVIFHCLISMHRAPMCAKIYKESIMQLGRHQDVAILEGGFSQWRDLFSGQPSLIEDECIDSAGAQSQYALGFGLGQKFVADVNGRNGSFHSQSFGNRHSPSQSFGNLHSRQQMYSAPGSPGAPLSKLSLYVPPAQYGRQGPPVDGQYPPHSMYDLRKRPDQPQQINDDCSIL